MEAEGGSAQCLPREMPESCRSSSRSRAWGVPAVLDGWEYSKHREERNPFCNQVLGCTNPPCQALPIRKNSSRPDGQAESFHVLQEPFPQDRQLAGKEQRWAAVADPTILCPLASKVHDRLVQIFYCHNSDPNAQCEREWLHQGVQGFGRKVHHGACEWPTHWSCKAFGTDWRSSLHWQICTETGDLRLAVPNHGHNWPWKLWSWVLEEDEEDGRIRASSSSRSWQGSCAERVLSGVHEEPGIQPGQYPSHTRKSQQPVRAGAAVCCSSMLVSRCTEPKRGLGWCSHTQTHGRFSPQICALHGFYLLAKAARPDCSEQWDWRCRWALFDEGSHGQHCWGCFFPACPRRWKGGSRGESKGKPDATQLDIAMVQPVSPIKCMARPLSLEQLWGILWNIIL